MTWYHRVLNCLKIFPLMMHLFPINRNRNKTLDKTTILTSVLNKKYWLEWSKRSKKVPFNNTILEKGQKRLNFSWKVLQTPNSTYKSYAFYLEYLLPPFPSGPYFMKIHLRYHFVTGNPTWASPFSLHSRWSQWPPFYSVCIHSTWVSLYHDT